MGSSQLLRLPPHSSKLAIKVWLKQTRDLRNNVEFEFSNVEMPCVAESAFSCVMLIAPQRAANSDASTTGMKRSWLT